jgi:acetate kinase
MLGHRSSRRPFRRHDNGLHSARGRSDGDASWIGRSGALLYLLRHHLTLDALDNALEHDSGLAGLSGISGDVSELERSDDPAARLALEVFTYRVANAVGSMAVALGGLDALVFTAGIGENSASVREAVCGLLAFLGVELDAEANAAARPDATISASAGTVRVVIVEAREDIVAARAGRHLLAD